MPAAIAPSGSEELPVTALKGVGPRLAERLARLGVERAADLLLHLPLRYQDRTRVTPMGAAAVGEEVVVEGTVEHTEIVYRRRRALLCRIADGSGSLTLRFFHFSAAQRDALARGRRVRCFGELRAGPAGGELVHPEFRVGEALQAEPDTRLTPVYPTTEGIYQQRLRALVSEALLLLEQGRLQLDELLPGALLARLGLPALDEALRLLHAPPADSDLQALLEGSHPARKRLAFEELLAHGLGLRALRARARSFSAPALAARGELARRFREALPFALTAAQERVSAEIGADLEQAAPMLRLVQGDVGSGKTVVAALAVLRALECGYQAAVMAPTELLAEQHLRSFSDWLGPLGIDLVWLAGRSAAAPRRAALARLADGSAQVAVGTHALFQAQVEFARLGLVVIDEQHRFGVHQRLALRQKGVRETLHPHQLIMTATPIPRTLAMTAYADLDCSTIDELPPGRTPVQTAVMPESRRADVIARIREACAAGRQAYWVCPLVEESEVLQCQAAEQTATLLREALGDLEVGLVHGRLKARDKEAVMRRFQAGAIHLLVATTVIEVGVDVPNASLMIIDNAERLGLAQLHQLRGRIGRGALASSCLLVYRPPLGEQARARLQVMRETSDGFAIAQKDLEMRGPGELLGTRQTGQLGFRIADLNKDRDLITRVRDCAADLERDHPERVVRLVARWRRGGEDFATV